MSSVIGSVPKLVIVRIFGRHVSEESAGLTDDAPRTELNEDLAIASSLSVRVHVRRCPPRAFRALDSVSDLTHGNDWLTDSSPRRDADLPAPGDEGRYTAQAGRQVLPETDSTLLPAAPKKPAAA